MLYVNPTGNSLAPQSSGTEKDLGRRQAALKELDQLFVFQLLQEMRKTVPKDGLLGGGGMAQDTYNEMLDDAMAGDMAKSGQFGVAQQVEAQLNAIEAQQKRVPSAAGFLPLHPEAKPMPLDSRDLGEGGVMERSYLPLKSTRTASKAYSLIKAPMSLADN